MGRIYINTFHSGVDFRTSSPSEVVRAPFIQAFIMIADYNGDEWRLVLGSSAVETTGWVYEHVEGDANRFHVNDLLSDTISTVASSPLGDHVHIEWCFHIDSMYVYLTSKKDSLIVYDTYINPMDYFINMPTDYDTPKLAEPSYVLGGHAVFSCNNGWYIQGDCPIFGIHEFHVDK